MYATISERQQAGTVALSQILRSIMITRVYISCFGPVLFDSGQQTNAIKSQTSNPKHVVFYRRREHKRKWGYTALNRVYCRFMSNKNT